jgi:threonine/homoserine/homoserine lactone efflux protein
MPIQHGIGLAAGLSALIVASATAYTTVKLAGAAYLIWLGIQAIRTAKKPPELDLGKAAAASRHAYLQGLLSTVLNPKPALFFLTFLPQFVDTRTSSIVPEPSSPPRASRPDWSAPPAPN